jgi:hypothetical protein
MTICGLDCCDKPSRTEAKKLPNSPVLYLSNNDSQTFFTRLFDGGDTPEMTAPGGSAVALSFC